MPYVRFLASLGCEGCTGFEGRTGFHKFTTLLTWSRKLDQGPASLVPDVNCILALVLTCQAVYAANSVVLIKYKPFLAALRRQLLQESRHKAGHPAYPESSIHRPCAALSLQRLYTHMCLEQIVPVVSR